MIAGPGIRRTHSLALLLRKHVLVDRIPPDRIILTPFTRKAATELVSRLIRNRQKRLDAGEGAAEPAEATHFYIGTLSALCSQFLQDQRYWPTLRIRVLEEE